MLQHLQVYGRIPYNTLFADLFPAGLKLGLNQAGDLTALPQQAIKSGKNQLEGDEGHVDGCKIQLIRDLLMGQIPGIRALHADHARIIAQLPVQLAIAHIHGINLLCTVLQHAVRKSAGGGADVGADLIVQIQGESLHRFFQLQAAPAHILQRCTADLDLRIVCHGGADLVHPLAVDKNNAGHDRGLGLLPGIQQPTLGKQNIQTGLIAHGAPPQ